MMPSQDSNPQHVSRKSDTVSIAQPRHRGKFILTSLKSLTALATATVISHYVGNAMYVLIKS